MLEEQGELPKKECSSRRSNQLRSLILLTVGSEAGTDAVPAGLTSWVAWLSATDSDQVWVVLIPYRY